MATYYLTVDSAIPGVEQATLYTKLGAIGFSYQILLAERT